MLVLSLPNEKMGSVVGSGGAGLRRLWVEAQLKVTVHREVSATGERRLEMTGTPAQLQQGQAIVQQLLDGHKGTPNTLGATGGGQPGQTVLQKRKLPADFAQGSGLLPPFVAASLGHPMGGQMGAVPLRPPQHMGGHFAQQMPQVQLMHQMHGGGGASGVEEAIAVKLVIEADKVGLLVGRAGAGLKQLREASGSSFALDRDETLGGRLLVIQPPGAAQQRCVTLICDRMAMGGEAVPLGGNITLKVLCPTTRVGAIIGKGGAGLRDLRSLGVTVDMPRDDVGIGERLLTLSGPATCVCTAVGLVLEKLTGAPLEPSHAFGGHLVPSQHGWAGAAYTSQ